MELKEVRVMACICALFFCVGLLVGNGLGVKEGYHSVYKGTTTCETLLDGAIRCVETTKVRGK